MAERLEVLRLQDNPTQNPPEEVVLRGREHIAWHCREGYARELRGCPPKVASHAYGTAGECRELEPRFKNDLLKHYARAEQMGELDLKWLNLDSFPQEISKLTMLTSLRLVGSRFADAPMAGLDTLTRLTPDRCGL